MKGFLQKAQGEAVMKYAFLCAIIAGSFFSCSNNAEMPKSCSCGCEEACVCSVGCSCACNG